MHVASGVDGERLVITQPMISRGVRYMAKDRHDVLSKLQGNKPWIDVTSKTGWPNDSIAKAICGDREIDEGHQEGA